MSDKPIAERLQVKGARRLAVLNASALVDQRIGATERRCDVAAADVVLLCAADRAQLDAGLPELLAQAPAHAIIWIAYPKLASPLAGDLNRDLIRNLVVASGLETVSQIAIDDDWSALRMKRIGQGR